MFPTVKKKKWLKLEINSPFQKCISKSQSHSWTPSECHTKANLYLRNELWCLKMKDKKLFPGGREDVSQSGEAHSTPERRPVSFILSIPLLLLPQPPSALLPLLLHLFLLPPPSSLLALSPTLISLPSPAVTLYIESSNWYSFIFVAFLKL